MCLYPGAMHNNCNIKCATLQVGGHYLSSVLCLVHPVLTTLRQPLCGPSGTTLPSFNSESVILWVRYQHCSTIHCIEQFLGGHAAVNESGFMLRQNRRWKYHTVTYRTLTFIEPAKNVLTLYVWQCWGYWMVPWLIWLEISRCNLVMVTTGIAQLILCMAGDTVAPAR